MAVAPARVVLTAELVGGANDFEEYYCPTISWDWGDDTTSESTVDCEPYEAGKSEIKRRFTVQHIFRQEGSQKVFFRLKRGEQGSRRGLGNGRRCNLGVAVRVGGTISRYESRIALHDRLVPSRTAPR